MKLIQSQVKNLGDDFLVRRILPSVDARHAGPFVFVDHFGPTPIRTGDELSVRSHPHIGLATISYLYSGTILHRDSLGTEELIRPFEVNWMTAGNGIVHSERSRKSEGSDSLEGIQTWVALPKEAEDMDPEFFHYSANEIPELKGDKFILRLLAGNFLGLQSPVKVYSPLFYSDLEAKAGAKIDWSAPKDWESAVYLAQGSMSSGDKKFKIGEMAFYQPGESINLEFSEDSRCVALGGLPHPEPRHLYWNFVSSSKEAIEDAKVRWYEDRFPKVPNETDRIPLPG
ncbi:pirin family protein [Leptospira sp. GIMC2001]|uniref:pirin family protein n=1 Tax=Leptospira sp. GIMC2001 TaxID=1513297 RepID=UPI0023490845|nr:pirin family protein [Leptospira sp. GIMC2001]WCL49230.1 pirin family protein [Leptospira sp. GIMC2001]